MDGELVYLAQTDTTVGFLSHSANSLIELKKRAANKKFITIFSSFKTLSSTAKTPKSYRKFIRNSKKTSFVIYPKLESFRVCPKTHSHNIVISHFGFLYSTSANIAGCGFDSDFALNASNVVVYQNNLEFKEERPSRLFLLRKKKRKKLRG